MRQHIDDARQDEHEDTEPQEADSGAATPTPSLATIRAALAQAGLQPAHTTGQMRVQYDTLLQLASAAAAEFGNAAREQAARAAQGQRQDAVCALPACSRPRYVEPDGRQHDFCGRSHADAYLRGRVLSTLSRTLLLDDQDLVNLSTERLRALAIGAGIPSDGSREMLLATLAALGHDPAVAFEDMGTDGLKQAATSRGIAHATFMPRAALLHALRQASADNPPDARPRQGVRATR